MSSPSRNIDLSVIFPIYNASHYPKGWVERALSSVLDQQEGINVEVCIGDDGSTDTYLYKLKHPRIKMTRVQGPTGGSTAANAACNMAQGRYFIILSCRSWYEPQSLVGMVNYLDENENIGFVYGNTIKYLENGYAVHRVAPRFDRNLFLRAFPTSFGYMYRREFWDEGMRYGVDLWAEDEKRWITIGDHYMLAQIVQKADGQAIKNLQVLHYRYGEVDQSNDILSKYKNKLYRKFFDMLGDVHV